MKKKNSHGLIRAPSFAMQRESIAKTLTVCISNRRYRVLRKIVSTHLTGRESNSLISQRNRSRAYSNKIIT